MPVYVYDDNRCFAVVKGRQCKFARPGKSPDEDQELCTKHQNAHPDAKCIPIIEDAPPAPEPSLGLTATHNPNLGLEERATNSGLVEEELLESPKTGKRPENDPSAGKTGHLALSAPSTSTFYNQSGSTTIEPFTCKDGRRFSEVPQLPLPSPKSAFHHHVGNTSTKPPVFQDLQRPSDILAPRKNPTSSASDRLDKPKPAQAGPEGNADVKQLNVQMSQMRIELHDMKGKVSMVLQGMARLESTFKAGDKTTDGDGSVKKFVRMFEERDSWIERSRVLNNMAQEIERLQMANTLDKELLLEAVSESPAA